MEKGEKGKRAIPGRTRPNSPHFTFPIFPLSPFSSLHRRSLHAAEVLRFWRFFSTTDGVPADIVSGRFSCKYRAGKGFGLCVGVPGARWWGFGALKRALRRRYSSCSRSGSRDIAGAVHPILCPHLVWRGRSIRLPNRGPPVEFGGNHEHSSESTGDDQRSSRGAQADARAGTPWGGGGAEF